MKKLLKSLFLILFAISAMLFLYLNVTVINPKTITIRRETMISDRIPASLNEIKIVFFSDIHYGKYVDQARLKKIIETVNTQSPDVVLFGGDLFEMNVIPSEENQKLVSEIFSQINAPLGKFAVLGEWDQYNEEMRDTVEEVLFQGNFEILNNQSIRLRNKNSGSIVLTGLNEENPSSAFTNVQNSDFIVAFAHNPETVFECPTTQLNLFLAGHTHGGQITLPFFGSLLKTNQSMQYINGTHQIDNTLLDITNGTGTTEYDYRLLADAEIVVYTLNSAK